jgi:pyruvate/2-oxoglutarate dehydrogenase complex dihydrolipoamide dehydrogenase (E3) component
MRAKVVSGELVQGEARFTDHQTLSVGDRSIRADAVVLATGARPAILPIEGLANVDCLASTSLLSSAPALSAIELAMGASDRRRELSSAFRRWRHFLTVDRTHVLGRCDAAFTPRLRPPSSRLGDSLEWCRCLLMLLNCR